VRRKGRAFSADLEPVGPWTVTPAVALPAQPSGPRRRIALWAAGASVTCWALGLVASLVWLRIRPPCPPGYVRLIDLGCSVAVAVAGGALLGVAGYVLARNRRLCRTVAVLMCASTAVALLVVVGTADTDVTNWGARYDNGFWTF
jgi:hypothetical protein